MTEDNERRFAFCEFACFPQIPTVEVVLYVLARQSTGAWPQDIDFEAARCCWEFCEFNATTFCENVLVAIEALEPRIVIIEADQDIYVSRGLGEEYWMRPELMADVLPPEKVRVRIAGGVDLCTPEARQLVTEVIRRLTPAEAL